jgi:hypothetical protein
LVDQALERPGKLIVLLGVPLDRGDGYPQDAAALAGDGLELLRAAIDGRGADDLAGREPHQDALPILASMPSVSGTTTSSTGWPERARNSPASRSAYRPSRASSTKRRWVSGKNVRS